jgi:hypothetical protein
MPLLQGEMGARMLGRRGHDWFSLLNQEMFVMGVVWLRKIFDAAMVMS